MIQSFKDMCIGFNLFGRYDMEAIATCEPFNIPHLPGSSL
jgi:hypothetical protein|nr:MAG TPA: hypothetical protein [Caudoviricetes sp.]